MESIPLPLCIMFREPPLTALARQTQMDTDILPPRPAEAKPSIATRYYQRFCLKGMILLPGQVAQAKGMFCLRNVCVCLWFTIVFFKSSQQGLNYIASTFLEAIS